MFIYSSPLSTHCRVSLRVLNIQKAIVNRTTTTTAKNPTVHQCRAPGYAHWPRPESRGYLVDSMIEVNLDFHVERVAVSFLNFCTEFSFLFYIIIIFLKLTPWSVELSISRVYWKCADNALVIFTCVQKGSSGPFYFFFSGNTSELSKQ